MKKAIFLDRDGIINEDTGYPHKPDQIIFVNGIFEFCNFCRANGFILVVITNQAGIAKGRFTDSDVEKLHLWMRSIFLEKGVKIENFYYCPFHIEGSVPKYSVDSYFRKPKPGMFLKAAEELSIDISQSFMIGDKTSDRIEMPDLRSIIVKSKYTGDDYDVKTFDEIKDILISQNDRAQIT